MKLNDNIFPISTNAVLEDGYLFHVQFHITNACNLRCKHCYEGTQHGRVQWDMVDFKNAIDKLWAAFAKWGVKGEISLIGGEPTLHSHFEEMVRYLYARGDVDSISILTNGVSLNPDTIKLIKDCHCCPLKISESSLKLL